MNKLALLGALSLAALSLAGCAQIANGINEVSSALTSPQTTQAVANLKAGSQAILCAVADVSAVGEALTNALKAKQAIVADAQDVYVVSGALCVSLGGKVVSTVTVPASVETN